MTAVLYFSASGAAYETHAYTKADIAELVDRRGLQSLTSGDRQFDYWFAPSAQKCQARTNRTATELLLATTTFTARTVPLLRGCVVVTTHDPDGTPSGLSEQQLDLLVDRSHSLTRGDERALTRRIVRDGRRRRLAEAAPTALPATGPRPPVPH
jgi:hypothetical protein